MAITITEALEIIYKNTKMLSTEVLPIEMIWGRILASDQVATFDLPRFDNSSMDGYAVKVCDAGKTVHSDKVTYAGDRPQSLLTQGNAFRIMTGAPIPKGCEAIVPLEKVIVDADKVTLPQNIEKNDFIRKAGEDMKTSSVYLQKGERINAYGITLLVSQGVTHVEVYRKIKVAVFSSGDELRSHYETIEDHQLYNSNTPMFIARSKALNCEVTYLPSIGDTLEKLQLAIKSSLNADLIITSGGMHNGDKDFTQEAFKNSGMKIAFDKVEIKPGRPIAYGYIGDTAVVNLPGNPLASMVNYEVFIRSIIHKMSGDSAYYLNAINARLSEDFKPKRGKYTVTLGIFDGELFTPIKKQMAGMVAPMAKANAMMIVKLDLDFMRKGDKIKIIPIAWEFFSTQKRDFYTY
ncbi:Molybdopterin biosynthesis protein MoeA [hydrothermal vent metagenome]|uniref:Molybdopterin biosynthesis protein MoeA n=1 Tax=hydrothermal vent metagenome TaxID=652676 RepID=A0A1W1EG72_9ZZZZ